MHLLMIFLSFTLVIVNQNPFCHCDSDDFQANVDGFMKAFDYSSEVGSTPVDTTSLGNEIPVEQSTRPEELDSSIEGTQTERAEPGQEYVLKTKDEDGTKADIERVPVQEKVARKESVFQLGEEIKHQLTEEVRLMAERAISSISPQLRLVKVIEAMSMVSDKVHRSLSVLVSRDACADAECVVACRVELVSHGTQDEVTWHNCISPLETNEVPREKRGAVGGFKQVDDAEANFLAKTVMNRLDEMDADKLKRHVVKILRAQKQLVNGIMYHLTLEVALTTCDEDEIKCEAEFVGERSICKILLQKLFNDEAPHNAQLIKSECTPISQLKELEFQKRVRRQADDQDVETNLIQDQPEPAPRQKPHRVSLPGGKMPQDANSARIQEIADFALKEIDKSSNSMNKQKIVRVVHAHSQVVAGIKYFLKLELIETDCQKGSDREVCNAVNNRALQSCDVVIWDKPWEKYRSISKIDCHPVQNRFKRSGVPGGLSAANPQDPDVKEMAEFAVAQLDAKSNSMNSQKLLIVKEAKKQVVAGMNYYLKIQLVETNCIKGSAIDSSCSSASNKVVKECDVVVYNRPWDKHREMTSADCRDVPEVKRTKRETPVFGGLQDANPQNPDVKEMAEFAVAQLDAKSNSMNSQKLLVVKEAKTQVVAGINYYLKIELVETNCIKGSAIDSSCSSASNKVIQECDVVVNDRSWEKHRKMLSADCRAKPETKRTKRESHRLGGLRDANPQDPEIKEMAKFAVAQLDARSNSMNSQKLLYVKEAKTQVVAGMNYYLKIDLVETNCRKGSKIDSSCNSPNDKVVKECDVVVYNRPWDKHREMTSADCRDIPEIKHITKRSVGEESNTVDEHHEQFEHFKQTYNKVYKDDAEHLKRFRIFRANLKKIKFLQENEQGTATYGPNMFADLSAKEFKQKYLGLKPGVGPKVKSNHMVKADIPNVELPTDFDWRDRGVVTPVKNQGMCGSCWAFSVTGNVEGQYAIKHKQLLSLSEQELVDCDKKDSGCGGGYMTTAYEVIEELGGLETEQDYPYDAMNETCKLNKSEVQVTVSGSVNITSDETQLAQWLYANGPVSIGINANAMQFYFGGVSHPFKFLCNKDDIDHGVLLVGFGVHRTSILHKMLPYWLVKNSWGPHWGDKGYYRVYRGDSTCGVNQMASSAIVD